MATLSTRQKLISYLADADDSTVKAIYTLLKIDNKDNGTFKLSKEQLQILDEERELYLNGKSKNHTREESLQIIMGNRPA
jgi:hypothetical protein